MTTLQGSPGGARFTVEDFDRMARAGVFEGRHVELLDGELYEVTKNPPHDFAVDALAAMLRALLAPDRYIVREEKSIGPWERWSPEPDVAVVRGAQEAISGPPSRPGVIAISAMLLQGVNCPPICRTYYAPLRDRKPKEVLGDSIYLYDWPLR